MESDACLSDWHFCLLFDSRIRWFVVFFLKMTSEDTFAVYQWSAEIVRIFSAGSWASVWGPLLTLSSLTLTAAESKKHSGNSGTKHFSPFCRTQQKRYFHLKMGARQLLKIRGLVSEYWPMDQFRKNRNIEPITFPYLYCSCRELHYQLARGVTVRACNNQIWSFERVIQCPVSWKQEDSCHITYFVDACPHMKLFSWSTCNM